MAETSQSLSNQIKNFFKSLRSPANVLPAILMACSLAKRPGLSCISSTAAIISSQSGFGAPTTAKFEDGTPNMMNQLINNIVCEVYRAIQQDMNIQVVIPAGSGTTVGTGANAGGAIVVTSTNLIGRGMAQAQ